jgi:uncharacterized protein YcsI (UPF0317 family)
VQANLVALPSDLAFDFLLFCQRNPSPCPVLEVVEAGGTVPTYSAPGADLRTDLPRYSIYQQGKLTEELDDVRGQWRDDLVSFLLGCAFSFQEALVHAGIPVRHLEEGKSDPTFVTSVETVPAGVFSGPMVVSMWPIPQESLSRAVQITTRFPALHGAPVHIGDPAALGIKDLTKPDYGDVVELRSGEVPVFWGCGVTPQEVAIRSKPPLMITHSAGHMFITDRRYAELAVI